MTVDRFAQYQPSDSNRDEPRSERGASAICARLAQIAGTGIEPASSAYEAGLVTRRVTRNAPLSRSAPLHCGRGVGGEGLIRRDSNPHRASINSRVPYRLGDGSMQNPRSDLNRLSPRSKRGVRPIAPRGQSGRRDLNPRPLQSKCSTLPTAPLPDAPLTGCTASEGSSCANTRGHQTRRRRRESNAQPSSGARFRDGVALPLCRRLHRRGDRRDSNSLPRRPQRRASTSSASVTI